MRGLGCALTERNGSRICLLLHDGIPSTLSEAVGTPSMRRLSVPDVVVVR